MVWKLFFILVQMSFALSLVSKVRLFGTRKWPIAMYNVSWRKWKQNHEFFLFLPSNLGSIPKNSISRKLSHTLTFKTSSNNRDKIWKNVFWSTVISLPTNTPPPSAPLNIFSPNPLRMAKDRFRLTLRRGHISVQNNESAQEPITLPILVFKDQFILRHFFQRK